VPALRRCLAAGDSTEEADGVRWTMGVGSPRSADDAVICHTHASSTCRCRMGSTALGIAAQQGHLEAVRTLLAAGADINAVDTK